MFPIAAGLVRSTGGRPSSWAATGRSGGVSHPPFDSLNLAGYVGDDDDHVLANRRRLAETVGASGRRMAVMDAVHGASVATVSGSGVVAGVDGLVTQEPGLAIVALGADCVPVGLVGDDGRTIGVAHCGWRGLVVDVVGSLLSVLHDHGCGVAFAVLGPAVCGACYPVPAERAGEVARRRSAAVSSVALTTCADGQSGIDVRRGVGARLIELGVEERVIVTAGGCTVEDRDLFSYRRDGITGRQGVAVCLAPGPVDDHARRGFARMEP